ncbi:prephenate dehydrogenase/arogenate dehydrogenase family protein [Actinoplanes oblitus]|uniref:Prephenate dehydrogenase/arogenate dehydrogenase family protein n=1 Tax=Actinoplanes oblitus TaxID=3040509 RepID=A0ABY8WIX4_9ACTN|nr:prephenate dehydrogenase/arogenate dehydrogenase family protein [Actinoplanes oblitus]WIM96299.1 prephenate dehydrogenase/arogenate dehydrogenase family protein [Actinoplanes oblitus]
MHIAVIGLGLIGGSLLRALVAAGHEVTGYDADPATRELARAAGHDIRESAPEATAGTEVAVLAVPLPAMPRVLADLAGYPGLLTDVTSVKGPVRELAAGRRFVGGHPMAGTEASGFAAADPGLFAGCVWVLCLEPHDTGLDDWLTLARLYTALGARVLPITAAEHDNAVASISHVPHLLAAALAGTLESPLNAALAAGSFRDGTRVAATRPELTAAMCGGNAGEVLGELRRVIDSLERMRDALESGDPVRALVPHLRRPAQLRRTWPPAAGVADRITADAGALLGLGRAGGWVTEVHDDGLTTMRPGTDLYRA